MPQAPTVALPKRLPLVIEPSNRGQETNVDARLVNAYMEVGELAGEQVSFIYDRPGVIEASRPPGANASGLGVYNWRGNIYSIFGATLYRDGTPIVGTVDTSNGVYAWSSCLGATPKLIFGNGVKAYTYDGGAGLVQITDGDFPSSFLKGWAYLDGTTYVMRPDAGIQGDEINDPQSWDPLNVIIAQIEPDFAVALAKQLVYVIAMKQWTTEVFYDAANATGSPLGQVQGALITYGCASPDSVQDIDGSLFYLATAKSAGTQVMMISSLKAEIISTPQIERLLQGLDYSGGNVASWNMSIDGHRFYVVTNKPANLTLVYDVDQKRWTQWTDASGNYSKIVASTYDSAGRAILQHETNGRIYYSNTTYQTDDGTAFPVDIITPNFDAGVRSRAKDMPILRFVADQQLGQILQVRFSYDDYQTWSEPIPVDLGEEIPQLVCGGSYYKMAMWIRKSDPLPFRMMAVEPQLDVGIN